MKGKSPKKKTHEDIFCAAILSGKSNRDAYLEAYPGQKKSSYMAVSVEASRLRKKLEPRIRELVEATVSNAVLSRTDLLEMISDRTRAAYDAKDDVLLLKAASTLAAIAGYNAPAETKITMALETKTDEELLEIIEGR